MSKGAKRAGRRVAEKTSSRWTLMRQGKITSYNTTTKTLTVIIEGISYTEIKYADHIVPVVNAGVWMADLGGGRFLAMAVTS